MNRKLKFRSWNLEDKNWENSAYLELDGNYELKNIMLWKYPEKYIIQQFTGLKDKKDEKFMKVILFVEVILASIILGGI